MNVVDLSQVGRANYEVYSNTATRVILRSITDTEHALGRVAWQLSGLEHRKQALLEEQKLLRDQLNRYKRALAPYKKLPKDIIQYIFDFCVGEAVVRLPPCKAQVLPQVVLSHVCSAWRQVALDTVELWNRVHLNASDPVHLNLAKHWLSRAGNSLITLVADVHHYPHHDAAWVRALLSPYHFKTINLYILTHQIHHLSDIKNESVAHLETLHISLVDYGICFPTPSLFTANINPQFPQLREFTICPSSKRNPVEVYVHSHDIPLPWHNLRTLSMIAVPMPPEQCLHALRQTFQLKVCQLNVSEPHHTTTTTTTTEWAAPQLDVILTHLESLELKFKHGECFGNLINSIRTPKLHALSVDGNALAWSDGICTALSERLNLPNLTLFKIGRTSRSIHIGRLLANGPMLSDVDLPGTAIFDTDTITKVSACKLGGRLTRVVFRGERDVAAMLEMLNKRENNRRLPGNSSNGSKYKTRRHVSALGYVEIWSGWRSVEIMDSCFGFMLSLAEKGVGVVLKP
ncbi:hypothetical protein AMATHDRAFT_60951 [Amanita thiersii Skay4041]|uniref:F-box domain-containing protein n=1 Tax=Amanita thiersii Skay4041 TaxID=703135 RepID=A0A2A9NKC4_9AGAR|nr:hypothetical protein AMATHDRAFT_60951 [Amanita thiersii Skay4041]